MTYGSTWMKHISIIHSTLYDLSMHFVMGRNMYAIKDVVAFKYLKIVPNDIKILKIFIFTYRGNVTFKHMITSILNTK